MDLWGDLTNFIGGGGSGGYSGLTPDQQQMVTQQGWFPRPDMVLPTGQSLQQPEGYSGLTPAQSSTVNSLGYYSNQDAAQPQSLWDKLTKGLTSSDGQDAIKNLKDAMAGPQALNRPTLPPSVSPYHPMSPNNIYTARQRTPLDPRAALKTLMMG